MTIVIQYYYKEKVELYRCSKQTYNSGKKGRPALARQYKHDKVIRSYDGIDREESTAGLMFLRIFIMLVIIAFIAGASALFVYNLQKETDEDTSSTVSTVDTGAFYQKYDTDVEDTLLEYCNNSVTISEYDNADLTDYNDKIKVNSLMKTSLDRMIEDAAKDGISIEVVRGYMSFEECNTLNRTYRLDLENEGSTAAEAEVRAAEIFPPGGSNEYQTGMLVKLSSGDSQEFALTDTYAWLYKNGINYGFINRYTADKFDITGIVEDLTVYRFVGTENAQKMRSFGMCLEEYSDYKASR